MIIYNTNIKLKYRSSNKYTNLKKNKKTLVPKHLNEKIRQKIKKRAKNLVILEGKGHKQDAIE